MAITKVKKIKDSPVDRAFGIWKIKETGLEYQKQSRKEWEKKASQLVPKEGAD